MHWYGSWNNIEGDIVGGQRIEHVVLFESLGGGIRECFLVDVGGGEGHRVSQPQEDNLPAEFSFGGDHHVVVALGAEVVAGGGNGESFV